MRFCNRSSDGLSCPSQIRCIILYMLMLRGIHQHLQIYATEVKYSSFLEEETIMSCRSLGLLSGDVSYAYNVLCRCTGIVFGQELDRSIDSLTIHFVAHITNHATILPHICNLENNYVRIQLGSTMLSSFLWVYCNVLFIICSFQLCKLITAVNDIDYMFIKWWHYHSWCPNCTNKLLPYLTQ